MALPNRKADPPRSNRDKVLAEWRGYMEPLKVPDRTLPVSAVVSAVLEKLSLPKRITEEDVLAAWAETVGPTFAPHSQPDRLRDGKLYIRVLQPTIRFELQRQGASLATRLRERFGEGMVREVRFMLG